MQWGDMHDAGVVYECVGQGWGWADDWTCSLRIKINNSFNDMSGYWPKARQ